MIGIYKITSPNNKIYIGQSINIEARFNQYYNLRNCKGQIRLYNSFIKYSVSNHKFEVLIECNINELNDKERYYQDLYNCTGEEGLNCILTKTTDKSGKHSKKTKEKISKTLKGRKRPFMNMDYKKTTDWKEKMSKSMLGKKHSDETKEKMSLALLGNKRGCNKKMSEEEKENLKNKFSKIIIDLSTGIFYTGTKEAALYNNFNQSTLKNKLNGNLKNNTNLIYC